MVILPCFHAILPTGKFVILLALIGDKAVIERGLLREAFSIKTYPNLEGRLTANGQVDGP